MANEPTSEQIRRDAQQLRDDAKKLIDHAKALIEKSAELEKQIAVRSDPKARKRNERAPSLRSLR